MNNNIYADSLICVNVCTQIDAMSQADVFLIMCDALKIELAWGNRVMFVILRSLANTFFTS